MEKKYYPFDPSNPLVKCILSITDKTFEGIKDNKSYGFYVDADDYVSISRSPEIRTLLFQELSKAARDLFYLIPLCLNKQYKYVILPKERRDELMGDVCNIRTYSNAINELIRHTIIDHKDRTKGEYWVNHRFFFFGSRKDMFPENTYIVRTIHTKPKEL